MKNGKTLHKIIGCAVVMLTVFVFTGTGYSRTPCTTCQSCGQTSVLPAIDPDAELQYRDGFPGHRRDKRQQVRKLQCMLRALGYCSGPIDGWYGGSTARAVMLFLADNFQVIGYGKKVTTEQWEYLVHWAGERCTKYDEPEEQEPETKPCTSCGQQYYQYQGYQGQGYQYYQQNYQQD
ncbi:MAG: peptidoglycan-binding protein [Candidatus Electrothrix sp. AUS4]|nr:peptidoglycan-binding protein [Candidatus Electrothrix sp. AUS4]